MLKYQRGEDRLAPSTWYSPYTIRPRSTTMCRSGISDIDDLRPGQGLNTSIEGGGCTPLGVFADSRKTAAHSAAVLGTPYPSSISHRSTKFWGQVMSGHGAIQGHVTQPQNPKSQVWRGAKGTTVNRSNWNFHNIIRSWGTTNRHNKNFPIVDLRWGQFSGHPIISLWGKKSKVCFWQIWH